MKAKISDVVAVILTIISIIILGCFDMSGKPAAPASSTSVKIHVRYSNLNFTDFDSARYVSGQDTIWVFYQKGCVILFDESGKVSSAGEFWSKFHEYP